MPRELEYKPLLYTTTIRNPERYKDFMHILKRFDGEILNDHTVELFERELFKVGLYRPMILPNSVKQKWALTQRGEFADEPLTDVETATIYRRNDPNVNPSLKGHKEAGYPKGWPSRFDTQFKLMKVLGFVYYEWGKRIEFSQTGDYLADTVSISINEGVISREIVNPRNEQVVFMQAFAKQQRCNPFVRELNDNIPLILLLEVIKKLNADDEYNGAGISYKEIPLVIFWKDNNAEALYQRIKLLRNEYKYNPSNEVIEDMRENHVFRCPTKDAIKILEKYENNMHTVEKSVFNLLKEQNNLYPDRSIQQHLIELKKTHEIKLIQKQVGIFKLIDKYAEKIKPELHDEIRTYLLDSFNTIKENGSDFSRIKFIKGLENILQNYSSAFKTCYYCSICFWVCRRIQ